MEVQCHTLCRTEEIGPSSHMDISNWLQDLGLGEYEAVFVEHGVDPQVLQHLTAEDLKDLGVLQVGHRRKLLTAIAELGRSHGVPSSEPDRPHGAQRLVEDGPDSRPTDDHTASSGAERRQLTVMFCDLVASTELASALDPEDYRDVIHAYHRTVSETVMRFEGHVAKYMGDGVLSYFGYPRAHEDDAERALRAGLAVIEAVGRLDSPHGLQVRIGVDTGLVVVGDLAYGAGSEEHAVAGETPNLAARLQTLSDPNGLLISGRTRRLVGELFDLENLGTPRIKGFSEPVEVWRVLGENAFEDRFEALHAVALSPLVGREEEIRLLLQRWSEVKDGDGQAVLLVGEPGIGKSRIVRALIERLGNDACVRFHYQCSPYFSNTAFHPLVEWSRRVSGIDRNDVPERQLAALEAAFEWGVDGKHTALPLIASLLSIPLTDRYPPLDISPKRQKELTLEFFLDQLEESAKERPVLTVFEDVHWIDPSSRELLERMVARLPAQRVLLIATCRPEFVPPWGSSAHVATLSVNRLAKRQGMALAHKVAGGKTLPREVLDQILAKTDGVALFIEEITKTVLESGLLREEDDRYLLKGPLPQLAIPATLHDSLMARLDRSAPVKDVAQIGAVIGREFSYELLSAVAPLRDGELRASLDRLVDAGLVFRRDATAGTTYVFKHALVQDAAYASLLRDRRRDINWRIAEALRERFPAVERDSPEILAHYCTEAGRLEYAIGYWRKAGENAMERSAGEEAAAHLTKALELTGQLPDDRQRSERELSLQISLAPVLMLTEGFGSPQVRQAYMRARDLCRQIGDPDQLFMVTFGLWHVHQNRGDLQEARVFADEVLALASEQDSPAFLLQAHHAAWTTLFHLADQPACRRHTEQGRALYDPAEHRSHKYVFGGHDPGVCARNHGALALWLLGYPERAISLSDDAIALAKDLNHAMSLALAHCFRAFLHQFRAEPEAASERSEEVLAICAGKGIAPHYVATARILRGWAASMRGRIDDGVEEIRVGLSDLAATEMNARRPHYLTMLAEAEARSGHIEYGLDALDQAEALIVRTGERRWVAEVLRLRGELLEASGAPDSDCLSCYRAALQAAEEQGAKSLELRAATSLARLEMRAGRRGKGRAVLSSLYDWFSEGSELADLRAAKRLLKELA